MTKFLCLLTLGAACAVAQTVEGRVLDSVTGAGIPDVGVTILQNGKAVRTLTTDLQGHFLVEALHDGAYELRCYLASYWPTGPGSVGRFAIQKFKVSALGNPASLEIYLTPTPTLTGRVVDGRGEGVRRARVQLIGAGFPESYGTSPDGTFSFHDLRPCAYTVWVSPPVGWKPPDPEPDTGRVLGWARTFYPGVTLPEAASKIVLEPGAVEDIELKLLAVPAHLVRGVLLNPDGTPAPDVDIELAEAAKGPPAFSVETQSDGTFEFPAVVDGEWRLFAATERRHVDLQAAQWIEISGHEIDGIKLRLSPPFTVRVNVVLETPQGMPAPEPPAVSISPYISRFDSDNGMFADARWSRTNENGELDIEGVYPGAYIVNGTEPPGYYLEPANQQVEITGPVSITLVYKSNGGTVRGTVEKCASGRVVLIPRSTAASTTLLRAFRGATCDSNDRYEITAVPPGDYYALAIPGNHPTPWFALQFNDSLLKLASSVTVSAGEATTVDLRAITR